MIPTITSTEQIKFLDLQPYGKLVGHINVAYDRVLNSGTYIGGKEVADFERMWAEYCQAEYCVGVGNGHDALALSCAYLAEEYKPVKPTIITPWKTCLPTWTAARNGNCSPMLSNYAQALFIAVHIYGQVTLPKFFKKDKLIEDCAQAHGASKGGIPAGKFGKIASWSFYPTKNLGALGDAGAVTTDDQDVAEYVRTLSHYGTRDDLGINSRLDPLQAAILKAKMSYFEHWNARRKENAQVYLETIVSGAQVDLPTVEEDDNPCWHIFAIETDRRDELKAYLAARGIETAIHYPIVPYPTYCHEPEAERWAQRTLSLPVAPHVTPKQCRMIANYINEWMGV